jgi:dipeptidyl aminopeptidase/acylaminoacyl peptidase
MGGQITLRSMVVTDDIKAGVIWAGTIGSYPELLARWQQRVAADPSLAVSNTARRWGVELVEEYGSPEENPAFWASISPNSYLADLSGPIQLHHGSADSSVPVEFSETLYTQIQEAGGVAESYIYTSDDHNISVNFSTAMARSVAFFDRYLKSD